MKKILSYFCVGYLRYVPGVCWNFLRLIQLTQFNSEKRTFRDPVQSLDPRRPSATKGMLSSHMSCYDLAADVRSVPKKILGCIRFKLQKFQLGKVKITHPPEIEASPGFFTMISNCRGWQVRSYQMGHCQLYAGLQVHL